LRFASAIIVEEATLEWYMNRSLSPIDVYGQSRPFEEELRQSGDAEHFTILHDDIRSHDPEWLLIDEGFTLAREHETESLFAIGNGYIGNRGSLAEGSLLSSPATFVAGIFEQLPTPGSVPELMVLPDWTGVRIWIDQRPLSMQHGKVLEHRRILDFRQGILWREWRHCDPEGRITRIVAFRLASLADRHLLLHSVTLTPENYNSMIRFESSMEATEGAVSLLAPEWKPRRDSSRPNILPLALRVPGRDTIVAFGLTSQMLHSAQGTGCRVMHMDPGRIMEHCEVELEAGTHCHLDRSLSVFTSRDGGDAFERSMEHLREVVPKGTVAAVRAHAAAWEARWKAADVEIEGDEALQRALRFAEYHLISAANPDDPRVSIGARTLSGPGYKGHVFWDTETYIVPFFIFTHPPSARALLEYRYHTLDAARSKAHKAGFRGAMYPWESADTGDETTPQAVITPSGEIIRVPNGEMEVHITADIAYAVWQYWQDSGDDEFFVRFGAEIMVESARFWASRGATEPDGSFHIRHVIGPDEYHEDVDDDAYTNLMARWNLQHGAKTAHILEEQWPNHRKELATRLQFTDDEVNTWPKLANSLFIPFDPKTLLYEQFRGYFNKQPIDLKSYEPRSAAMDTILGHDHIQKTNVVKQADVVLAAFLLEDEISPEVRTANFHYYEPRTGHGSSLSPSIHALVAARMGHMNCAETYLKKAAEIDLGNNMGNAAGGVHAAALGGLWQAVVFGFAGFRTLSDGVSFAPNTLSYWRRLSFPLQWRGRKLHVRIEPQAIRVTTAAEESLRLALQGGSEIIASAGHEYIAERNEFGWGVWREFR
jgi:trehalose/maltose hydrolase-like predicted phosphorylase